MINLRHAGLLLFTLKKVESWNRDCEVNLSKRDLQLLYFFFVFLITSIFSQTQNLVAVLSDADFHGFILYYQIRSRVKNVNKP